jgi:hypothetical protein
MDFVRYVLGKKLSPKRRLSQFERRLDAMTKREADPSRPLLLSAAQRIKNRPAHQLV